MSCGPFQRSLGRGGLEQFDGISGRVLEQDLLAAHSNHDVIAEVGAFPTKRLDDGRKIRDLKREPVPAARLGDAAIRHSLATTRPSPRRAQYQTEVTSGQHREAGSGMHVFMEAEVLTVELDRGVDIIDDVADADRGHQACP